MFYSPQFFLQPRRAVLLPLRALQRLLQSGSPPSPLQRPLLSGAHRVRSSLGANRACSSPRDRTSPGAHRVTAEVGKSTPLSPELVENATVTPESVVSCPQSLVQLVVPCQQRSSLSCLSFLLWPVRPPSSSPLSLFLPWMMLRPFLFPRQLPAPCPTLPFSSHHYLSQSIPPDTPLRFLPLRLQCKLTFAVPPPSSSLPLCPARLQHCIYSHPPHPLSCAARRLRLCYACSLQACPVGTPLVPCCVTTSLDWWHPLGGEYCQGSALAALSVLSLFNVSLVVL